ncbi:hypothetical protein ACFFX0_32785 [Citricoccus parietis]|uniref:Uncharacterized protein n=1 Tax=Citricoccus parietis TaxID=592307 RepID=A0ABV5G9Q7_9MICC
MTPSRSATTVLDPPSAHSNTILDRCASACEDFLCLVQRRSCSRSSSLRSSSAFGRPVRAIPQFYDLDHELTAQDTSATLTTCESALNSPLRTQPT